MRLTKLWRRKCQDPHQHRVEREERVVVIPGVPKASRWHPLRAMPTNQSPSHVVNDRRIGAGERGARAAG